MRAATVAFLVACTGTTAPIANGGHTVTPPGDATLALFEPAGAGCALQRVDPTTRATELLATFPNACAGARIAWRPDRLRAVVWFDPSNAYVPGFSSAGSPKPGHPIEQVEIKERLYDADLVAHTVTVLDVPAELAEAAYASDGTLYAFTEQDLPNAKGKVTVRGRELDFTDIAEGMPAAALAFARRGGRWELTSVTKTTTGWDYAAGWEAAPEAKQLGPRSADALDGRGERAPIADAAVRAALDRIAPSTPDEDGWTQIGELYAWMFVAEFSYPTGRLAWRGSDGAIALVPGVGFTAGEAVAISARGRYVLIASIGAGMFPRLYDLVEHRRVFASDTARAAMLWPR